LGDDAGVGLMLNSLGATLKALHRLQEAQGHLREALPILRRSNQAQGHLREALPILRRSNQAQLEGHALALLGEISLELDHSTEAVACLEASLAFRQRLADARGEGWMFHSWRARTSRAIGWSGRASRWRAERTAAANADGELLAACQWLRQSSEL